MSNMSFVIKISPLEMFKKNDVNDIYAISLLCQISMLHFFTAFI